MVVARQIGGIGEALEAPTQGWWELSWCRAAGKMRIRDSEGREIHISEWKASGATHAGGDVSVGRMYFEGELTLTVPKREYVVATLTGVVTRPRLEPKGEVKSPRTRVRLCWNHETLQWRIRDDIRSGWPVYLVDELHVERPTECEAGQAHLYCEDSAIIVDGSVGYVLEAM